MGSNSIEFTIRQTWYGPVIFVRKTIPADGIGSWKWRNWRKANDTERNAATVKLMELNKI